MNIPILTNLINKVSKNNAGEKGIEKTVKSYKKAQKTKPAKQNILNTSMNVGLTIAMYELSYYLPELGQPLVIALSEMSEYGINYISDSLTNIPITRNREKFFNQLTNFKGVLSPERIDEIRKTDFVMEFAKTLETVDRLARDEKINYMANLFGKYFIEENHEDNDPFEEFLYHLTVLSFREIEILVTLYKIEIYFDETIDSDIPEKNLLQKRIPSTNQLLKIAPEKWNMDEEEMLGVLTSLCRSGFIREITGSYLDYDGGIFYTTKYFEKFLSYIEIEQET